MTSIKIFGAHDERTKAQMARCMQYGSVVGGVLCADGHLGYAQPVGGVIAYREHVSVDRVGPLLADVSGDVSFGIGRTNAEKVEHDLFDHPLWHENEVSGPLKQMARDQLGTVGSGNHYVDLFADADGLVWIGVHFGSRGLGDKTATAFIQLCGGADGIDVAPTILHQDSDLGRQYIAAMTLAGAYAYA